jgi:hypothetical protein
MRRRWWSAAAFAQVATALIAVCAPLMLIGMWASYRLIQAMDKRDARHAPGPRRIPKKKLPHRTGSRIELQSKRIGQKPLAKPTTSASPLLSPSDADAEDTGESDAEVVPELTPAAAPAPALASATKLDDDSLPLPPPAKANDAAPVRRKLKVSSQPVPALSCALSSDFLPFLCSEGPQLIAIRLPWLLPQTLQQLCGPFLTQSLA